MLDEKTIYSIVEKAQKYDSLIKFPNSTKEVCCSFCGKSQGLVEKLVAASPGIAICNECIELCVEIIKEEDITEEENLTACDAL